MEQYNITVEDPVEGNVIYQDFSLRAAIKHVIDEVQTLTVTKITIDIIR